eukprot:430062-Amphidinium_carterae.1
MAVAVTWQRKNVTLSGSKTARGGTILGSSPYQVMLSKEACACCVKEGGKWLLRVRHVLSSAGVGDNNQGGQWWYDHLLEEST